MDGEAILAATAMISYTRRSSPEDGMTRTIAALVVVLMPMVALAAPLPKLAVMRVETHDTQNADLYTETVTTELTALGRYQVISYRDIEAMLGYRATQQTLDCNESICLAEIGGALGAEKLLVTQIDFVGSTVVSNAKLIDMHTSAIEGRSNRSIDGASQEHAIEALRDTVRALFGLGPVGGMHGPSVVAVSAGAVGVVGLGAATVFGLAAKHHQSNANDPSFVGGMHEIDKGKNDQTIANIGFAVGGAGLLTSLAWWWFVDNGSKNRAVVQSVNLAALPGGGAILIGGNF